MSNDIDRIKSACALREWEDSRSKNFAVWRSATEKLLEGLSAAVKLGSAQHLQLASFVKQRMAAENAYAQALTAPLHQFQQAEKGADKGSKAQAAAVTPPSPVLGAMMSLQGAVSKARASFASSVLEGILLAGVTQTTSEFEKTAGSLLQSIMKGLSEVDEANVSVVGAMTAYHRGSIHDPARSGNGAQGPDADAWLQEHRYRRAVALLREKQRDFTSELCSTVQEIGRLEVWRDEMAKKVLNNFCTQLHKVETSVQSLANDGFRVLADTRKDPADRVVLRELEKVLNAETAMPPQSSESSQQTKASAASESSEDWPALRSLKGLGRLGRPPATVLSKQTGALQTPRRWTEPQLCVVVLSKDKWLHCFHLAQPKEKKSSSRSSSSASRQPAAAADGIEGLEALEAEPQWSMYAPSTKVVSPVAGKQMCFEVEEVKKGFLGWSSHRREILQANTDESLLRWLTALVEAGADAGDDVLKGLQASRQLLSSEPSASRPPPPPPPPPTPPPETTAAAAEAEVKPEKKEPQAAPPDPEPTGTKDQDSTIAEQQVSQKTHLKTMTAEDVFGQ
eukprot:TRINITY_DN5396_c0_g1_i1.p1 TRINITY_DN5396_c0_g1~~TRINITY_DN5396_c0_g1_i1.p1  ORF type:complete len:566 (+),score=138.65 TRINITY_DN5396_c0_g1_i1:54-1751(+)